MEDCGYSVGGGLKFIGLLMKTGTAVVCCSAKGYWIVDEVEVVVFGGITRA